MGMISNDFSDPMSSFAAPAEENSQDAKTRERHRYEVRRRIEERMERKRLESQIHDDFDDNMSYLDY